MPRSIINEFYKGYSLLTACLQPDTLSELRKADLVLLSADSNRSETTNDGLRYDRLLDSLAVKAAEIGLSSVFIGRPPTKDSEGSCFSRIHRVNRHYFFALAMDAVIQALRQKPRFRQKLWVDVFSRIRPKAVFMIGARDDYILAARELGIPFFEVLHSRGYTSTEGLFRVNGLLPDNILAFDSQSSNYFRSLGKRSPKVWDISNYWTEAFHSAAGRGGLRELFPDTTKLSSGYEKVVLVTLQWGFSGELGETRDFFGGSVPRNLDLAILQGSKKIMWLIRMHPTQWFSDRGLYLRQKKEIIRRYEHLENVNVVKSSSYPLPLLLGMASSHVTVSSTTTFEANEFGLKTLVVEDPARVQKLGTGFVLSHAIENGIAEVSDGSFHSICEWVLAADRGNPSDPSRWGRPLETILADL